MKIPHQKQFKKILNEFSLTEKIIFGGLSIILVISAFSMVIGATTFFTKDVPAPGGEIHEGIIGYPHFINPLLAITDSGKDLTYLTYAGLTKIDENGIIVPDLAEKFTISDNGKVYTFTLRNNAVFHDRTAITAEDVAFTIAKAKDVAIKSPIAGNWQGVEVNVVDPHTITFTLKTAYAPFLQNTVLGIMPKHIWNNADINEFTFSSHNFDPIGSGPYLMKEIKRDSAGLPVYYKLDAFQKFASGAKNISTIYIHVYPDEDALITALQKGIIQSAGGISPARAAELNKKDFKITSTPLLRIFGVFFNQNQQEIFMRKEIREALNDALDRTALIDKVLEGFGTEELLPLPHNLLLTTIATSSPQVTASTSPSIDKANDLLEKNGWKLNDKGIREKKDSKKTLRFSFSITTGDNPDLVSTANELKKQWEKIGAEVTIETLSVADLNQQAIRPRKYDALLFGEVIGRGDDLFPFWHSSERKDPGLNIALYTNSKVDKLLETSRTATSTADRVTSLAALETMISDDVPALFLYSPDFIYIVPKRLLNFHLPPLEMPFERWTSIFASYVKTKKEWK